MIHVFNYSWSWSLTLLCMYALSMSMMWQICHQRMEKTVLGVGFTCFVLTILWCWFLRILHLCLDSGIFTCLTPGYYAVSFSAYSSLGLNTNGNTFGPNYLYLFKNNEQVPESGWELYRNDALNAYIGLTASRNLVSHLFGRFSWMFIVVTLPDASPGCRRQSGSENDRRKLGKVDHSQHWADWPRIRLTCLRW